MILYPLEQPATAAQVGAQPDDGGYPLIVISDGRILSKNLAALGLDENWLEKALKARGIKSAEDIFLMTVNEEREIYLASKEAEK